MAAAANDEEENNVLFNDLNDDLVGAYRGPRPTRRLHGLALTAQARAWPYY